MKNSRDEFTHPDFYFCGYDFRPYGGVGNFFSVLLHEVINGRYDQLRRYAHVLNQYCLLPSLIEADVVKGTREALKLKGASLETEEMRILCPSAFMLLRVSKMMPGTIPGLPDMDYC